MDTRQVKGIYDCKPYTTISIEARKARISFVHGSLHNVSTNSSRGGYITRELLCQGMLFFIGLESVGLGIMRWYEGAYKRQEGTELG